MTAGLREEHITSVRFSPHDGNVLAVGTSMGRLQLWDVEHTSLQRTMLRDDSDPARIPALAWRDHVVTTASRTGEIRHHDIRVAQHLIGYSDTHTQGGLKLINLLLSTHGLGKFSCSCHLR